MLIEYFLSQSLKDPLLVLAGFLFQNLTPINMSKCHVTRQWLVTETTRATIILDEILEKSKEFNGSQMESYKSSIKSAIVALRMIRYFSIPYDPEAACSKENCCRRSKPYHWYASNPEFPEGQE